MKKLAVLFLFSLFFSICAGFAKKRDKETGVRIAPSASVYQNDSSDISEEDFSAYEELDQNYENNDEQNYEQDHQYNFVQNEVYEKKEVRNSKSEEKRIKKEAKQLKRNGWEKISDSSDSSSQKILIKRNGKNMEVIQGTAKMQTVSQNGSVAFFVAGLKKSWFPVIETSDFAESTYISLFIDGIEHRLNRSRVTDYYFEVDDNSITVTYSIARLVEFKVTYRFAETKNNVFGLDDTSILVSYSLVNIDRMAHSFVLKAVYNTILGENSKSHFSIQSNSEVNSETIIIPSDQNKYVISSDGKRNVKFIIYENGLIVPKKVVLANKDTVENASLSTDFKNGRPFNSLFSYSNSSIALFWEEDAFAVPGENIFYRIELANYDLRKPLLEEPYPEPPVVIPEPEPVVQPEPEPEPVSVIEAPEPKPVKETYPFKTERNYLDPSINENYVRKLIDQINTLERSDPDLNREKIQELQNEIDEVLRILRSRR